MSETKRAPGSVVASEQGEVARLCPLPDGVETLRALRVAGYVGQLALNDERRTSGPMDAQTRAALIAAFLPLAEAADEVITGSVNQFPIEVQIALDGQDGPLDAAMQALTAIDRRRGTRHAVEVFIGTYFALHELGVITPQGLADYKKLKRSATTARSLRPGKQKHSGHPRSRSR